jgi:hypothetical protein
LWSEMSLCWTADPVFPGSKASLTSLTAVELLFRVGRAARPRSILCGNGGGWSVWALLGAAEKEEKEAWVL